MSLKHFALIAAVGYHSNHSRNGTAAPATNATTTSGNPTSAAAAPAASASTAPPVPQLSTTTAKTLHTSPTSGASQGYNGSRDGNGNGSSTPAYYGGLSFFHQQNIRSGSGGLNAMNSAKYEKALIGNVNLLLGGAMLSLVTTILCVVCYCCHRNIKKRTEAAYRQQRQWLENDPNIEIYSVEQCYETSGLFLGESTDGLSAMPALHHEPPPSYDAVVAMQEQQQQLLHHQHHHFHHHQQQQQPLHLRTSPPPGYRSSLDVSAMAVGPALSASSGALAYSSNNNNNNNNNDNGDSNNNCDSNLFASSCSSSENNVHSNRNNNINNNNNNESPNDNRSSVARYDFALSNGHKPYAAGSNRQLQPHPLMNPLVNMKRAWNAQSCCSLQRAEVENLWNAAAAAVAARATHGATSAVSASASTAASDSLQQSPPAGFVARKRLPPASTSGGSGASRVAAKLAVNEFGRRYLNQNLYRRGCPLCGKFRYGPDDALSLSTESGLDDAIGGGSGSGSNDDAQAQTLDGDAAGPATGDSERDDNNNNGNSGEDRPQEAGDRRRSGDFRTQDTAGQGAAGGDEGNDDDDDEGDGEEEEEDDEEECSCSKIKASARPQPTHATGGAVAAPKRHAADPRTEAWDGDGQEDEDEDYSNGNTGFDTDFGSSAAREFNRFHRTTADASPSSSGPAPAQAQPLTALASGADRNANPPEATQPGGTSCASASASPSPSSPTQLLDNINVNGIVRLDMSKIIDRTGLPTYEAALKLESSGYV